MIWIAPSEKDADNVALGKRLWGATDQRVRLEKVAASSRRDSRLDELAADHAEGILHLPAEVRFDYLLNRPETKNITS